MITSARASATRCCWPPEQLLRIALAEAGQAHEAERVGDAPRDLGLRHGAHLQAERHVLRRRHVREQRITLEHHPGRALVRARGGDDLRADADFAGGRQDEARDHAQRRGLAAAGWPEQRHQFAMRDASEKSRTASVVP